MKSFRDYFELKLPEEKKDFIKAKNIGKQFFQLLDDISNQVKIKDILNFVDNNQNPFNSENTEDNNLIFIVFDTETTGLTTHFGKDKSGKEKVRDQIYELAATAYNNNFEVLKNGTLHLKLDLDRLDYNKNPKKIIEQIKKYHKDITESNIKSLMNSFLKRLDGFKFDTEGFKEDIKKELPEKDEKQVTILASMFKNAFNIERLMTMTKAEKDKFKRLEGWSGREPGEDYKVERKKSETAIIEEFLRFINRIKKEYPEAKVYVVAQNLPYDKGMVEGELLDRNRKQLENILKFSLKGDQKKSITAIKNELKKRTFGHTTRKAKLKIGKAFEFSLDTQDVFKKLIKGEKPRQRILKAFYERIREKTGIRSKKLEKILDNPKNSVSLGFLGRIAKNKDWHTATNDVYVTIKATKNWLATIRLTHILLSIKEGKTNIKIRNNSYTKEKYPDLWEFIKENGLTSSEYNELKKSLGISVQEFKQANQATT